MRRLLARAEKLNLARAVAVCVLLLLFPATPARAVDPGRRISQYAHTAWRIQDGVFTGAPHAITQTADGYLWVGTQAELVRFDGMRFVRWNPPEGKRMPLGHSVYSLLGGRDGSLWIGAGTQLARLKDGDWINYAEGQGRINYIIEDRGGTVWFVRSRVADQTGPLCQVTGDKARCFGKPDGIPYPHGTALAQDSEGNFWVGGALGLIRWLDGSSDTYEPPELKSAEGSHGVGALAAGPDGVLWVGMSRSGPGRGLQQMTGAGWKPFVTPELDGTSLEVITLFLDRENALWVGTTSQGVLRIHDGRVDRFRRADGLSGDTVSAIYEDREGNLWVATTEGIDCFRDTRVVSFSTREGLLADSVASVLAAGDGRVWAGNLGALESLREGKVSSILPKDGLPGQNVTSLLEDHAGRLWVGVDNGLAVYEAGKFRPVTRGDGTPVGLVVAMAEDRDKNIWAQTIGNPGKLIRIQDFTVREEIPEPQVPRAFSLAADPQEGVWLGLASGDLARYRQGRLEVFPFPHDKSGRTYQITARNDGSILGASVSGLIGWKDGTLRTMTTRNGLPCDLLFGLVSDARDGLWLYGQCGLVLLENAEVQAWWKDPDTVVKVRLFDVFDGARPARTAFQPIASKGPDGRLWFANETVLQMIDPARLGGNVLPPPVHIEKVVADRESYEPRQDLRIPPRPRDLEIDYTALSFAAPQKVRFRYRLEGRDADWQEAGTRRQAFYSDLPPGDYRFRVIACNNDGVWNEAGAFLAFRIAPAWYQTGWFRLLCVATGIFILWSLYRLRVRQIARVINARFDERLAERTRLARDLHDTFLQTLQGSKMVADDALEQADDPARLRRAMEQLSGWLAQAVSEGRAALNSLRTTTTEKNDLAAALRRAADDCLTRGCMASTLSVVGETKEMHPIVRDEVYRIGYEAIRNACAHSGASQLAVELRYEQNLVVRVKDNGKGIDAAIVAEGKDGHFGLQGMRERAARIGGRLSLISSANSGTEVTVVVPGSIIYRGSGVAPSKWVKAVFGR